MTRCNRIKRLREIIEAARVDVAYISDPANIFYLSGFTSGYDAKLLISSSEQILLTDSRYDLQAEEESSNFELAVARHESLSKLLKALLERFKMKKIGFEGADLRFQDVQIIRNLKRGLGCKLQDISPKLEQFRAVKDKEELYTMKIAATIAHESFKAIKPLIKVGAIEQDIATELEYEFRKRGASRPSFPSLVASGPNGAKIHYEAGTRAFREGDMILIDFGCRYQKYASDETNTIAIGSPDPELIKVYDIVRAAHWKTIREAKCNISGPEIDKIARDHIKQQGYGDHFGHSTGHGLGLGTAENGTFHEHPHASPTNSTIPVIEDMVITVEPGIYLPGKGGVRIEGVCVMTKDGLEPIIDCGNRRLEVV